MTAKVITLATFSGAALVLSACGPNMDSLRTRAAFDLNCPAPQLKTTTLAEGAPNGNGATVGVTGCDQRATYVYMNQANDSAKWIMNSSSKPEAKATPESAK